MKVDKRLFLTIGVTLILGGYFWLSSRYPDLGEKASMGGDLELEGISFDAPFVSKFGDAWWKRVFVETGNWIYTNKKGMLFGFAFAACMMTALTVLPRRAPRSGFGNAILGALIGCPLGVCVNCATPIAKGASDGGARPEMSLSLLLSSPTFNVVVLTMMFALLPWYMAATKLVFSALFILIGIPVLCRLTLGSANAQVVNVEGVTGHAGLGITCESNLVEGWFKSLEWTAISLLKNLWRIVLTTAPMMVVAGILGAVVATTIPWTILVKYLPLHGSVSILLALGVIAALGTFLPVPMAFDVLIVAILLAAGVPVHFAMVLLFTLGLFSIYPYLVLRRSLSKKLALYLFAAVAGIGVASALSAHFLDKWWEDRYESFLISDLENLPPTPPRTLSEGPWGGDEAEVRTWLENWIPTKSRELAYEDSSLRIETFPFKPRVKQGDRLYSVHNASNYGLSVPYGLTTKEVISEYETYNRCIASGDVHRDGWPDVAVAVGDRMGGVMLFSNKQGKAFVRQRLDLGKYNHSIISYIALVDLDNDGWLDLFFSTYKEGSHIAYNSNGFFDPAAIVELPSVDMTHVMAAGFSDLDRDGLLEIVCGNWSRGITNSKLYTLQSPTNQLLKWGDGKYEEQEFASTPGETLSILFTDMNDDAWPDLIVANDFKPSDEFYLGTDTGDLKKVMASDGLIPYSTKFTMSASSADINNDLQQEIFLAAVSYGQDSRQFFRNTKSLEEDISLIGFEDSSGREEEVTEHKLARMIRLKPREFREILRNVHDPELRSDLVSLAAISSLRKFGPEPKIANAFPKDNERVQEILRRMGANANSVARENPHESIPSVRHQNVLLRREPDGSFSDFATQYGLGTTGWTWNARFADLDLDEWQDLFVVNGLEQTNKQETNFYYRNQEGKGFAEKTKSAGLEDYAPTCAYVYCDFDQDGDLDMISVPNSSPIRLWRNESQDNHSLAIELRDELGNYFGVGSVVTIFYGDQGERHQMREIQASGGFHSANAAVAHFGLGEHVQVDRVEVKWSTGELSVAKGPFDADARYEIYRTKN